MTSTRESSSVERSEETSSDRPASSRSIRVQLLLAVNSTLGAVLAVFLAVDYRAEITERVAEKHVALVEEAQTLLPAVERLREQGLPVVQRYVDEVCGRMQDAESPGHHIAVRMGGDILQAHAHHRASPEILDAMQAAAMSGEHLAAMGERELVVGRLQQGDVEVYVSEFLTNIRQAARSRIWSRIPRILLLAVVAGVVVNVVFVRLAARPLDRLVGTVREIAQGRLGAQAVPFATREFQALAQALNAMSRSLADAEARRRSELAKARRIQEHLMPQGTEIPGVVFSHFYQPATDVAGDYVDVIRLPDQTWLFCLADVTGHGVPAAMTAAILKALLLHATEHHTAVADILAFVNRRFTELSLSDDFASMALVRWDAGRSIMEYASAGHEPALLLCPDGALHELPSTGLLLGILETTTWDVDTRHVSAGSRLLMVTDGVTESPSPQGTLFGRRRLAELFVGLRSLPVEEVLAGTDRRLQDYRGGEPAADDVTAVLLEFRDMHHS